MDITNTKSKSDDFTRFTLVTTLLTVGVLHKKESGYCLDFKSINNVGVQLQNAGKELPWGGPLANNVVDSIKSIDTAMIFNTPMHAVDYFLGVIEQAYQKKLAA